MEDLATETDYDVLARLATGKMNVLEVGSFCGGSARAVLPRLADGGTLYCVDHFLGNQDDAATALPRRAMLDRFMARTEPWWDRLVVLIMPASLMLMLPAQSFDMAFIDASHDYKSVCRDIRMARALVKPGGIICGHDYIRHYDDCDPEKMAQFSESPDGGGGDGISYGVIRAVHEHFGRPNNEGAVWWVEQR